MLNIKKILVPTDLSASARRAQKWASDVAERLGAEIHVLHVLPAASAEPLFAFFAKLINTPSITEQLREKLLEQVESEIKAQGIVHTPVRQVVRQGKHVATEIVAYARDEAIDLIAMGTHGHRSLEHALGGTAGEVVRRAGCPVLTVRDCEDLHTLEEEPSVRHILIPVDFSEHAAEAIRTARELSALYQASLSLLFVAEERLVATFSDNGLFSVTTLRLDVDMVDHAGVALKHLFQSTQGPAARATYCVRNGHPAREILDFARTHDVDLIVMSTHGQTGLQRFSLGSVSEKVVRRSTCPVLTLKAFQ